jgi:hypothetical protein
VTALSSITVAIGAAAITVATAELHTDSLARAMLFATAGAGFSALVIVVALTVEAVRTTNHARKLHTLFAEYRAKALACQKTPAMPWDQLEYPHMSVGVHWKVSLPVALFLTGLFAMAVDIGLSAIKTTLH